MAEVIDITPNDDRFCVWVCRRHGVIAEGELAEGVDWSRGTSPVDGDVHWTGRFYCQRDGHQQGDDHEALLLDLRVDIEAALASRDNEVTE